MGEEQRGTQWPMPTEVLKAENARLKEQVKKLESELQQMQRAASSSVDAGASYLAEVKRLEKEVILTRTKGIADFVKEMMLIHIKHSADAVSEDVALALRMGVTMKQLGMDMNYPMEKKEG